MHTQTSVSYVLMCLRGSKGTCQSCAVHLSPTGMSMNTLPSGLSELETDMDFAAPGCRACTFSAVGLTLQLDWPKTSHCLAKAKICID